MEDQILERTDTPLVTKDLNSDLSVTHSVVNNSSHKSNLLILVLLIIFPPLAWYYMAKHNNYHTWIANIVIILGFFPIIISILISFVYLPYFFTINGMFVVRYLETFSSFVGLIVSLVLSIILVGLGYFLKRKLKKDSALTGKLIIISFILTYLSLVLSVILTMKSIINSTYQIQI